MKIIKRFLEWLLSFFEEDKAKVKKLKYHPNIFSKDEVRNKSAFEFYKKIKPLAEKWEVDPALVMAQWRIESEWGAKPSGRYNYFGIKATKRTNPYWNGEESDVNTHEYINGQKVYMKDGFRSYTSLENGINDYLRLLHSRYKNGTDLTRYATAPKYIELVNEIKAQMRKQIDRLENEN